MKNQLNKLKIKLSEGISFQNLYVTCERQEKIKLLYSSGFVTLSCQLHFFILATQKIY